MLFKGFDGQGNDRGQHIRCHESCLGSAHVEQELILVDHGVEAQLIGCVGKHEYLHAEGELALGQGHGEKGGNFYCMMVVN